MTRPDVSRSPFTEWIRNLFGPMVNYDRIPILWHYTSSQSLIDITTSREIWSTHITCLNDSSELLYWLNIVKDRMEYEAHNTSGNDDAWDLLTAIWQVFTPNSAAESNVYVSCFSEKLDDLSQWRAYGCGEGGVSIGFDGRELQEGARKLNAHLIRVNYNPEEHEKNAHLTALKMIELCRLEFRGRTDLKDRVNSYISTLTNCISTLHYVSPMFKNSAFREEQEWRIVVSNISSDNLKFLRFKQRGSILSSHFPLAIRAKNSGDLLPISSLQLGPSRNEVASHRNARAMLSLLGYPAKVYDSISRSRVTFQAP